MDNPATESSTAPLNVDSAAEAFSDLIDREENEAPAQAQRDDAQPQQADEAPADDPENPEVSDDDPTVTVKIDGKEVQVKLSELRNGYQRQSDYTRKTMEVAEQRRAAEAAFVAAQTERQQYAANLQRMQAQIESALAQQSEIDWANLIEADPQEYLKQRHLYEQRQAALQENLGHQRTIAAHMQADARAAAERDLAQQQEMLLAKLPEWRNPEAAKAEKAALREYLIQQGYDEASVSSVADARAVLLAHKAMLYDRMVGKADAASKRVANLPSRMERPGTGERAGLDRRTSSYQKLAKSGRVEDAAAVFASLI